jgi:putative ABC transport system substrate-binding protein
VIALLINPNSPNVWASLIQLHASALVIGDDPIFSRRRDQLVTLAAHHAVPAIYYSRDFAASGGLMTYGASFTAVYRQLGIYRRT